MNPKLIFALFFVAATTNMAHAIIELAAGTGAMIVGGLALLKLGALAGYAYGQHGGHGGYGYHGDYYDDGYYYDDYSYGHHGRGLFGRGLFGRHFRGKRSVNNAAQDLDQTFSLVAQIEPEQCYQRLICDLATGKMPQTSNDVILSLFRNRDAAQGSPKFVYQQAAELGDHVKDITACEIRYTCGMTGAELDALF